MIYLDEIRNNLIESKSPSENDDILLVCTNSETKCLLNYHNFCMADKCNLQAEVRQP